MILFPDSGALRESLHSVAKGRESESRHAVNQNLIVCYSDVIHTCVGPRLPPLAKDKHG
jgi:hypothetical protein